MIQEFELTDMQQQLIDSLEEWIDQLKNYNYAKKKKKKCVL